MTTLSVPKRGYSREQISVLAMNTIAFAANFAVWMMFSVIVLALAPLATALFVPGGNGPGNLSRCSSPRAWATARRSA